jgi:predicted permease
MQYDRLWLDLQYAIRQFRRNIGFAATVIGTAGLGIGLTAAMFSIIYGVLLSPLPFPDAPRVVSLGSINPVNTHAGSASLPDIRDWKEQSQSFQDIGHYDLSLKNLEYHNRSSLAVEVRCSSNLLALIGAQPVLGRVFSDQDKGTDGKFAVLGAHLWKSLFNSEQSISGQSIKIGNGDFLVVGVMPDSFIFPLTHEDDIVWIYSKLPKEWENRNVALVQTIGRLKPGAAPERAAAELTTIFNRTRRDKTARVIVETYRDSVTADLRRPLWLLEATVLAVWLIACINIVTLLLARNSTKLREVAIRFTLGARPRHLRQQFLAESILLALMAAVASILIANLVIRGLRIFLSAKLPFGANIGINPPVLCLIVALSFLIAVLFGILPALQASRILPQTAIREGSAGSGITRRQKRLRESLIVVEIALTFALISDAGLLVHALYNLKNTPLGFVPAHMVVGQFAVASNLRGGDVIHTTYLPVLERLEAISGVRSAGIANVLPFDPTASITMPVEVANNKLISDQQVLAQLRLMSRDTHRALGIRLLRGRFFDERDTPSAPWAVIINHTLASKFFPNQDPVGKLIRTDDEGPHQYSPIVGVVEDSVQRSLSNPIEPEIDVCLEQMSPKDAFISILGSYAQVVVRTKSAPETLLPEIRHVLQQSNPETGFASVSTMDDLLERSLGERIFISRIIGLFATAGLLISIVGLYGSIAYNVSRSRQDIAVRVAFGARPSDILWSVMGRYLLIIGVGLAGGLLLWQQTSQLLRSYLTDVRSLAWVSVILGAALILFCGALASYFPALGASRVDPMQSLRRE